jgi:uncharacterized membrane protein
MAAVVCVKLPEIPDKFTLTLPGMGELAYLRDSVESMPRPSSLLLKFLNSLSPALAPINSIIKLVDMIQAIVTCVTAVPKCFMTLSPGPLIKCFEKLFKALAALIALVPPMPYIRMIVDIVVLIRYLVDDLLNVFTIIDKEISKIKQVLDDAQRTQDDTLLEIGECARENLNQEMAGIMQVIQLIGKLTGLIFTIMESIATLIPGADEKVAEWQAAMGGATDSLGSADVTGFIPLGPLVTALTTIRNILIVIEQFGKAVTGQSFTMPEILDITVEN